MTSVALPASYLDAHVYDGAAIQHDQRAQITPCAIQPRDLALIATVARHKFLTAPQLLELWWPDRTAWAGQRRLRRLFHAGHLERFRPIARLGQQGHGLLHLRQPQPRLLRRDAILELATGPHRPPRTLLIEYDRTRRIDKNYDKLRRYDAFLCWWIHHTPYSDLHSPPYVLFVCQDSEQREQFLHAADLELTGHRWHPTAPPEHHEYVGRRRILFAVERNAHAGVLEAWRLPAYPPPHSARTKRISRVALIHETTQDPSRSQLRLPTAQPRQRAAPRPV